MVKEFLNQNGLLNTSKKLESKQTADSKEDAKQVDSGKKSKDNFKDCKNSLRDFLNESFEANRTHEQIYSNLKYLDGIFEEYLEFEASKAKMDAGDA